MSSHQEEEFELVLGNKQIVSLFFFAIVLFSVFFSLGYMVGFSRGQDDRAVAIASGESIQAAKDEVRMPDTLLEQAPRSPEPMPAADTGGTASKPASSTAAPKGQEKKKTAPPEVTRSSAATSSGSAKPQASSKPKPAKGSSSSGLQVAKSIHLQVSALRVRPDAVMLVEKLRAQGYRAALHDQAGDGWNRVLVGPFPDVQSAKAEQKRLRADGLKSLLRRP